MIETHTIKGGGTEVAILGRVLSNGKEPLTPQLARYFLGLAFDQEDKARMHELAAKNQEGKLSRQEQEELLGYAKAGCLLGILQSKARKSLKKAGKNKAT